MIRISARLDPFHFECILSFSRGVPLHIQPGEKTSEQEAIHRCQTKAVLFWLIITSW